MDKEELYKAYKKQCKENGTRPISLDKYFELFDIKEQLEKQEKKENLTKIEWLLEKKDMSIYRLAREIGESDQTTGNIVKKDSYEKKYKVLKKIAKALDVSVDELFWG